MINTPFKRNAGIAADDPTQRQFVGLIIQYIGSEQSCLLTAASNNSIASAVGSSGSEAADTNFTVGSTPGTIDLTNAAADTMGELVDFINGLSDYRARLVGTLRADDADVAGALVAVSSKQAKVAGGYAFAMDTSVCKHVSFEVSAFDGTLPPGFSKNYKGPASDYGRWAENRLIRFAGTNTYTGTDSFKVYEIDDVGATAELIYSSLLSTVTAASTSAGGTTFAGSGIIGRRGRRLLVRAAGASSFAITNNNVVMETYFAK